jgi:hypothetical protein
MWRLYCLKQLGSACTSNREQQLTNEKQTAILACGLLVSKQKRTLYTHTNTHFAKLHPQTTPTAHLRVWFLAVLVARLPELRLVLVARAALRSCQAVIHMAVQPAGGEEGEGNRPRWSVISSEVNSQTVTALLKTCEELLCRR